MQCRIAEGLVAALETHPAFFIPPDREMLLEMLLRAEIPESSRFSEEPPNHKSFLLMKDEMESSYQQFLLRRVVRNRNVREHQLTMGRQLWEALVTLGFYDSDVVTRRLRSDEELVTMMATCPQPYSLFGKLETYHTGGEALLRATRPLLVIPGREHGVAIQQWEERNTVYEEAGGIFGTFRRISPKAYKAKLSTPVDTTTPRVA